MTVMPGAKMACRNNKNCSLLISVDIGPIRAAVSDLLWGRQILKKKVWITENIESADQ